MKTAKNKESCAEGTQNFSYYTFDVRKHIGNQEFKLKVPKISSLKNV